MYFELYQATNKQWYWRLKSANHQIVATGGEGYVNKADALHGIDLVRSTSASTPVHD
jgi:uncharacterized protein YegP (UPF0339 family)